MIKKKKKNCFSLGQSLVEMIVVVGIVTVSLVALVRAAVVAVRNAQFARHQSQAIDLAREAAEWLRAERKKGFSQFASYADSNYCFNNLDWNNTGSCGDDELVNGIFKREVSLTKESDDLIKVEITVSWQERGKTHSRTIETYLSKS